MFFPDTVSFKKYIFLPRCQMPKPFEGVCLWKLIQNLRCKFVWLGSVVLFWSLATLAMTTPNRTTTLLLPKLSRLYTHTNTSVGVRNFKWFLRCGCAIVRSVCSELGSIFLHSFLHLLWSRTVSVLPSVAVYSKYVGSPLLASCWPIGRWQNLKVAKTTVKRQNGRKGHLAT